MRYKLVKLHLIIAVIDSLFIQQPSNNGPFSAPPTWQPANRFPSRTYSVPADENTSPPPEHDPNALYDNYPQAMIGEALNNRSAETDREVPSSPPLPPERKFLPKGDQLMVCFTFLHSCTGKPFHNIVMLLCSSHKSANFVALCISGHFLSNQWTVHICSLQIY